MHSVSDGVAWCVCVCLSVSCVLVTTVKRATTAESIEMPFGMRTCGDQRNRCRWECTLAPPAEYDRSICVSALMRSVATITVATCYILFLWIFCHSISRLTRSQWCPFSFSVLS